MVDLVHLLTLLTVKYGIIIFLFIYHFCLQLLIKYYSLRYRLEIFCICVQSLTVVQVWQDADACAGVFGAETATEHHTEGDVKAFLRLIQRVVDDNHTANVLHLSFFKTQNTALYLLSGDVVRERKNSAGDCTCSRACRECRTQHRKSYKRLSKASINKIEKEEKKWLYLQ